MEGRALGLPGQPCSPGQGLCLRGMRSTGRQGLCQAHVSPKAHSASQDNWDQGQPVPHSGMADRSQTVVSGIKVRISLSLTSKEPSKGQQGGRAWESQAPRFAGTQPVTLVVAPGVASHCHTLAGSLMDAAQGASLEKSLWREGAPATELAPAWTGDARGPCVGSSPGKGAVGGDVDPRTAHFLEPLWVPWAAQL